MNHNTLSNWMRGRAMAAVACAALAAPMMGCGSGGGANASGANQPPVNDYQNGAMAPTRTAAAPAPQSHGLSGKQKVVLLVGAAALYYLYRKHQKNAQNAASAQSNEPVYYLSKNGQVYYRDSTKRVHWVTPPPQGISVPADELGQYQNIQQLQGYDRSTSGVTDLSRFATQNGGM